MAVRLQLNGHTLDIERAELCDTSGRLVQLRPQALSVLLELARRAGEVVTKRDLMTRVWPRCRRHG
jgi:DNA-binding winged helix-turn-helix (wHTH) protein